MQKLKAALGLRSACSSGMECVRKLKAALAAVPVAAPCTAAAVAALSVGAHDAAQQLVPWLAQNTARDPMLSDVAEAVGIQRLPAACMPVLAWLAAGLRSGLPPAAHQQALEMTSMLLGVVSLVVPDSVKKRVWGPMYTPPVLAAEAEALALMQTLGTLEGVCKQLAVVASALMDTVFPTGGSPSTATSSASRPAAEPQQVAAMALAWHCMVRLTTVVVLVQDEGVIAPPYAAALTGSGLYQVLLEGALLLLAVDPAACSQAPDIQLQLSESLGIATRAAMELTQILSPLVASAWYADHTPGMRPGTLLEGRAQAPGSSSSAEPWMAPAFKLKVLMLAKLQWDTRHGPPPAPHSEHSQCTCHWPAQPLARALQDMISPCVAGDLLQQRAPGLLPHVCVTHIPMVDPQHLVVGKQQAEQPFHTIKAHQFSSYLAELGRPMRAFLMDGAPFTVVDALDLALLLEVTELQCLVCHPPDIVRKDATLALQQSLEVAPRSVRAEFAATHGETLLSIAEYLVEDVLQEGSGAAAAPAAGPQAAGQGAAGGTETLPSSGRRRLVGGGSPAVTLVHRVSWTQDTISTIGVLMLKQGMDWAAPSETGGPPELGGHVSGVMHSLFTTTNAPRVSRLLEVALRTPVLQGTRLHNLMTLLPFRLPLLHAAASSPAGSRALLSAATSAAKRQQVGVVVMSALVQSQGELGPAAARVAAAVPGPMGRGVAQHLMEQPDMAVYQAVERGIESAELAIFWMARAAALLDPVLAPLAAYLAARKLPPGQDSKPWAVEAALSSAECLMGAPGMDFDYQGLLLRDPQHMSGIMRDLTAALSFQQAAAVSKQAATLVKEAGGGAEEAEQLRQQLQSLWLGDLYAGPNTLQQQQPLAPGGVPAPTGSTMGSAAGSTSSHGATRDASQLPPILLMLYSTGSLNLNEVLAAGDPAAWSSALGPTSEADLRVASTALLAACKAAGAAAQLPLLVMRVQAIMEEQPWGQPPARPPRTGQALGASRRAADWALLLAPLLAVLLPSQQASELMQAAAEIERDGFTKKALLTPASSAHVLGLLGHVAAPGAPGCSYAGCCNLEGRSEAQLVVKVCSKCRGPRYCCREHQAADWKAGHKEVCQAAQAAVQQVRQSTAPAGP